jgi:mRNA-degrading endonuclease RelE of RelBE toxin-antitoxin system
MPNERANPPKVTYTQEFKRNLRHLAKKYRHIQSDVQPVIEQLEVGVKPGDQISGVQQEVFKVRARNTDAGKGKSGGYRIIYQVKSVAEIVLITIYSKSEQGDVAAAEIRRIIAAEDLSAGEEAEEGDVEE